MKAGEQPNEKEMYSLLRTIMYEEAQHNFYSEKGAISELAAHSDDRYLYLKPEQFVMVAKDYLNWDIAEAAIIQHFTQMGKTYFQDEGHYLSADDLVKLQIGDGDMKDIPCIVSVEYQDDVCIVNLCAAKLDYLYPYMRAAVARIKVNPDSVFGYTLVSYEDKPLVDGIKASSHQSKYPCENAMDDDFSTAWVPEKPVGEWIEQHFTTPVLVEGIRIYGGYGKTQELLEANNRIKRLRAELPDGTIKEWELPDYTVLNDYWINETELLFDEPALINSIRLTVLEVYPGSKYNDTCVSELTILPTSIHFENE